MKHLKKDTLLKYGFGFLALVLAVLRLLDIKSLSLQIDNTFLLLFMLAIILFIIPLEKIKAFKAAGVEFELINSNLQGALEGLALRPVENKQISETISSLKDKIELVKNGRILWIDDKPHEILGERRLFRALGLEIITANEQKAAKKILELDNDFDLIISDIQWRDKDDQEIVTYGGLNTATNIRDTYKNKTIGSITIIFYTGYSEEKIERIHRQTNFKSMENIQICHTIEELLISVVTILVHVRTNPIKMKSKKKPT